MIKPNELMIDNWVLYNDKPIKISGITENRIASFANETGVRLAFSIKLNEIKPIPITEEILEKCGFQFGHQVEDIKTFKKGMRYATLIKNTLYTTINGCDYELKSLHQFQNLYFILTGKQLEINL